MRFLKPSDELIIIPEKRLQCKIGFFFHSVMDYKNKNLLLNIPTRHVIDMTKENDGELRQQLKMLAKIDLNNFFILGSTETISKVFSVGNSLKLIGSKYAWYGLTKVS